MGVHITLIQSGRGKKRENTEKGARNNCTMGICSQIMEVKN